MRFCVRKGKMPKNQKSNVEKIPAAAAAAARMVK